MTYADTIRADSSFNNSTYYSYDVHGNIQTLIQDDSIYNVGTGQRYKRIDYQYDLISNNVNEVDYQNDSLDQYHHRYIYDADNRITQVQTSKDSVNWDNDASYFYYAHGPIARIELGDQQVQGMDYAYTLKGWIKGVNSNALSANKDMGEDGLKASGNLNSGFARDAIGYTVKYFDKTPNPNSSIDFPGDYDAIDTSRWNHITKRFEAKTYGSDLTNNRRDLFNGNPTAMANNIQKPQAYSESSPTQTATTLPQGTAYGYDQLNRLIEMKAFQNLDTSTNVWGTTGTYNGLYHNWLTYDGNGNILTQKRADSLGEIFDSLTYHRNIQGGLTLQNRLYHVNDAANVSTIHNDIKDEGTFNSTQVTINQKNNYRYNAMGQLAKDSATGIDTIIWTNYSKVWKIKKYSGDSIIFAYNGKQDRILKEFKPVSGTPVKTYYVRDAQGNILSVYTQKSVGMSMSYAQTEKDIYGTNRIGTEKTPVQLVGTLGFAQKVDTFKRYLGNKEYELDNYLTNVSAIVSDRKIPRPNSAGDSINHFEADLVSSQDIFPGGFLLPGRNFNSSSYRFGLNGKEKIDEITGFTGTDYDYGARMYDDRLNETWSPDPKEKISPDMSPYCFTGDNPVFKVDPDGQFEIPIHAQITENAAKLNKLTATQTFFLVQGARAADVLGFAETWHFDNKANYKQVSAEWKEINQRISDRPSFDYYGLGADLHNVQDFYSHSNYVELYVDYYKKNNKGATPDAVPTYDMGVKDAEFNKVLEGNLKTGTFGVVEAVVEEKMMGIKKPTDSHQQMNKDEAKGVLGKLAKDVAEKHSAQIIKGKQEETKNGKSSKSETKKDE